MHDTHENHNANLEACQQKEGEGSTQAHISERVPKRVRLGNDADLHETSVPREERKWLLTS